MSTSAYACPESGVSSDGLKTTVLPAARAGRIIHAGIDMGKFHGVIAAHTPKASWYTVERLRSSSKVSGASASRISSSSCSTFASRCTSAIASLSGLPISCVMSRPNSSARARNDSAASISGRARPLCPSASQAGCTARERSTMPGISSSEVIGTSPTTSPVAGL